MVTIALMADIHGNLEALDAVLGDILENPCAQIFCAGDLVGYGPRPNEVIERVRDAGIQTVMGNYDEAVGFLLPACGCHIDNPQQKALSLHSLKWSIEHTSAENRAWLRELPESICLEADGKTVQLMHASDDSIVEYIYQSDEGRIREILERSDCDIYVYGHTHYPYSLQVGGKWIINPGSVGRPKDLDPRASYIRLTIDKGAVSAQIRRVAYDVEKVAGEITKSGLDAAFAAFLRQGGDPDAKGAPMVCDLMKR